MAVNNKSFLLSVVVPIFNEFEALGHFHKSLEVVLDKTGWRYEIIYVDDGSTDNSPALLENMIAKDKKISVVQLSRNFGKESATTAGLHAAKGEAVIIIDGDEQHPVEIIPKFVEKWLAGSEVVVGVRHTNQKEGFVKRYGSKLFYKMLKWFGVPNVVPGSTDFRLIDHEVLAEFNKLKEHNRVTRALIDWMGYDRDYIYFTAKARQHGEPSYSFRKLLQLAMNGFISLSFKPLYLSGYMALLLTFLTFMASIFVIFEKYIFGDPMNLNITGPAILGVLLMFLVSVLLVGQWLTAVYVARIYTETQDRPLYIVKNKN